MQTALIHARIDHPKLGKLVVVCDVTAVWNGPEPETRDYPGSGGYFDDMECVKIHEVYLEKDYDDQIEVAETEFDRNELMELVEATETTDDTQEQIAEYAADNWDW